MFVTVFCQIIFKCCLFEVHSIKSDLRLFLMAVSFLLQPPGSIKLLPQFQDSKQAPCFIVSVYKGEQGQIQGPGPGGHWTSWNPNLPVVFWKIKNNLLTITMKDDLVWILIFKAFLKSKGKFSKYTRWRVALLKATEQTVNKERLVHGCWTYNWPPLCKFCPAYMTPPI